MVFFLLLFLVSNWFGIDVNGGDVLVWIFYGICILVFFGLLLMLFFSVFGVLVGVIQGYYGGKIDLWGQCFIEVWFGMLMLFLIILFFSVVQLGFWWLLVIIVFFGWMMLVGVVCVEFFCICNYDYVWVVQVLGVSDWQIILWYMLFNVMVVIFIFLFFILCSFIIILMLLDFFGFGLLFGLFFFGELLLQGKNNLQVFWLGIVVFFFVVVLLMLLIFIGEVVCDVFDFSKVV